MTTTIDPSVYEQVIQAGVTNDLGKPLSEAPMFCLACGDGSLRCGIKLSDDNRLVWWCTKCGDISDYNMEWCPNCTRLFYAGEERRKHVAKDDQGKLYIKCPNPRVAIPHRFYWF